MRRVLLLALAVALVAAVVPAAATEHPECAPADGRERLTVDGFSETIGGAGPIPDAAAVREETGGVLTPFRNAELPFQAAFGDAEQAQVSIDLTWDDPASDYDLHVISEEGFPLATSEDENPGGEAKEQVSFTVPDCRRFTVIIRNYAANPLDLTTLEIGVTPTGDAGDPVVDERVTLYAGGDPGQVSMVHGFPAEEVPFRGTLSTERPDNGLFNQHTRYVIGSTTERNPFQPHFAAEVGSGQLTGDVSALLYLSTAADEADFEGGEILVRLLVDASIVAEEAISIDELGPSPKAFFVGLGHVDRKVFRHVDLQVVAEPTVSPNNPDLIGEPADATWTLWYDSVQFPTRLMIPALQ